MTLGEHVWDVTNIEWVTDGHAVDLPNSLTIFCVFEDIADHLSDIYGFLVDGFQAEMVDDKD